MISAFILASLIGANDSKWPDPYFGFGARTFAARYPDWVAYNEALETDPEAELTYIERHQKFFIIGLPFNLKNLSRGDLHNYRLIAVPEILFNDVSIMFNGCIGLTQDVDFLNYRAWPLGWFWEAVTGIHYGYLTDVKDYDRSEGAFVGKSLRQSDRSSIAGVLKLAIGPRFFVTDKMYLKVRFGMDWAFGKLGLFMMRTRYSPNLGSMWGIQAQLDFQ